MFNSHHNDTTRRDETCSRLVADMTDHLDMLIGFFNVLSFVVFTDIISTGTC